MNHFSSSRVYKRTLHSLNAIWQGPQEPSREYLDQFNTMVMQIQDLDLAMELHSIKRGLQASLFIDSLVRRTMVEFKKRAMGSINMDEVRETRKVEAQTENRRVEDSRQNLSRVQGKKVEIRGGVTFTSLSLATMSIHLLMKRRRTFSKRCIMLG